MTLFPNSVVKTTAGPALSTISVGNRRSVKTTQVVPASVRKLPPSFPLAEAPKSSFMWNKYEATQIIIKYEKENVN